MYTRFCCSRGSSPPPRCCQPGVGSCPESFKESQVSLRFPSTWRTGSVRPAQRLRAGVPSGGGAPAFLAQPRPGATRGGGGRQGAASSPKSTAFSLASPCPASIPSSPGARHLPPAVFLLLPPPEAVVACQPPHPAFPSTWFSLESLVCPLPQPCGVSGSRYSPFTPMRR